MSLRNIDGAGLFFHTIFWSRLTYLMPKEVFRNFFRCRFISKNKLEIIELFGVYFIKLSKLRPLMYPGINDVAGLFFRRMFWNSLDLPYA